MLVASEAIGELSWYAVVVLELEFAEGNGLRDGIQELAEDRKEIGYLAAQVCKRTVDTPCTNG